MIRFYLADFDQLNLGNGNFGENLESFKFGESPFFCVKMEIL